MKKVILSCAVAVFALVGSTSFAADTTNPSKVGVVQIAKILQDSPEVKATADKLKKQFTSDQKAIEADQAALQKAMDDLKKNGSVMSKEDKAAADKKINDDRQALVAKISAFQQKVSQAQSTAMKTVFDALNVTVQSVAEQQGLDVVLDSQNVVYAVDSADITDMVEKAFNAKEKAKS